MKEKTKIQFQKYDNLILQLQNDLRDIKVLFDRNKRLIDQLFKENLEMRESIVNLEVGGIRP